MKELIDGTFTVTGSDVGTWGSYNKEGQIILTSLTEEGCIEATRFYLKSLQEGFSEVSSQYECSAAGKL